ncbi:MAG: 50S ribosomal protein L6 [Candidatus Bathyarchaeia archaeon]
MGKTNLAQQKVKVPEDVEVTVRQSRISVKGPLGTLERDFAHAPVTIRLNGQEVIVESYWPDKRKIAMVGTVRSHIRNMIVGVLKGFTYKLKVVFAHFPVNVKVHGNEVVIENFGGERRPRIVSIPKGVNVSIAGDDIILKGIDIQEVSQAAARIQQQTRIKKKDPRVFLDGIYIFERQEGM